MPANRILNALFEERRYRAFQPRRISNGRIPFIRRYYDGLSRVYEGVARQRVALVSSNLYGVIPCFPATRRVGINEQYLARRGVDADAILS